MTKLAKIFANGRSQAVRLPQEFRFSGTQVRVSRHGRGVLLEPVASTLDDWFADLDRFPEPSWLTAGASQLAPARSDFS